MSVLSDLNGSVNLVKSALDAKASLASAEDKEQLAEAKLALADLKSGIADLKEENQKLSSLLKTKDDYILKRGVYFSITDSNEEQPFCPVCYSKSGVVPLQKVWEGRNKNQSPWSCPSKSCGATYNPWDHKEFRDNVVETVPSMFNLNNRY